MKILCCGIFPALQRTLELKTLKIGSVNRVRSVTQSVGGKATNTARVLKTLGAEPLLFGFAGGDTGTTIQYLLDDEGIDHAFVETEIPTRTAQTLLADDAHDFTELIEDCKPMVSKDWKNLVNSFQTLEKHCDAITLAGTLPTHVPQDIYRELLRGTENKTVIIDTPGTPLLAALEDRPTLVKINASELAKTVGAPGALTRPATTENSIGRAPSPGEIEKMAHELIAQGAQAVGITRGKDSALLITPHSTHHVHIPEVKVTSTLGCGDSVNAGIAFALQKGSALPEAFIFGLACGASNARAALPGMVNPDQITDLTRQIQIQ